MRLRALWFVVPVLIVAGVVSAVVVLSGGGEEPPPRVAEAEPVEEVEEAAAEVEPPEVEETVEEEVEEQPGATEAEADEAVAEVEIEEAEAEDEEEEAPAETPEPVEEEAEVSENEEPAEGAEGEGTAAEPAQEEPSPCENGIVVPNPKRYPGLVSDCEALLASRDTLAGRAHINWDANTDIENWNRVTVYGDPPRVWVLDLTSRGLTGRIPSELGDLAGLWSLRLSDNQLSGPIPPELGALGELRFLYLNDNQLAGVIPEELAFLWERELAVENVGNGGGLTGTTTLTRVFLGGNAGLTGCIPPALRGALKHDLDELALPDCAPPCENGTVVDNPADNPALVRDCTALLLAAPLLAGDAKLDWDADTPITEWEGVTVGGNPARVEALELPSRGLTGLIPWQLGLLPELGVLRLHDNRLTGAIPRHLATLARLGRLELHDNQLVGAIPKTLGSLGGLQSLSLHGNHLQGAIPATLGYLGNLQSLLLSDNELAGAIPPELGYLAALERLALGGNGPLTGCIPPALRDVDENDLSGLDLPDCPPPPPPPTLELELELCENGIAVEDLDRDLALVRACAVLLATKDTLAGAGWLNWDAGRPIGNWNGVEIGWAGRWVISLDLWSRGLTGRIPPLLGSVPNLTRLGLSGNDLRGPIPPELGLLVSLSYLDLSGNRLTGEIPPALGSLPNLFYIHLSRNHLTGRIPPALGSLFLGSLHLNDNHLTGPIPATLRFPGQRFGHPLSSLWLSGNPGLTGCLPPGWERAPGWEPADGDWQPSRATCPPEPSPEELCENGTAVPDPAHNPALVADCAVLLAIRDPLAGDITLDWDADRPITTWEGITIGGDPPRVVALALPARGLTGHLPPRLGRVRGLRDLQLSDNQVSGPFPPEIGGLGSLQRLRLDGNRLIGPIPPTLGGLLQLETLRLDDNQLSGPIPGSLTYPRTLKQLSLNGNTGLTGCLAPTLPTVPENDLAQLGLPDCPPPIPPAEICENGTVVPSPADDPGLVSDCAALLAVKRASASDVPLNWDAGRPITEWDGITIGGTPGRVRALELWYGGLAGAIPPELGQLTELRTLTLRGFRAISPGNQLFGPIPAELGNLRSLRSMRLSGNLLSGPIPVELGGLPLLEYLDLSGNELTGPLPAELENLASLQFLDLSHNLLSGSIPSDLGSLRSLRALLLGRNQLTGPIPAELRLLHNLWWIWLDGNQLTGSLPEELEDVWQQSYPPGGP